MTHRNRAAIDVDLGGIELEGLKVAQHNRRKGFVDFEEIDVIKGHPGAPKHLVGHVDRTCEHERRIGADIGEGLDPGAGRELCRKAGLAAADEHRGRAIDNTG